ncbi:MAG: VOC family protein [SAR202 cluster bacterium]|jgi:glyoxylase I family protein|nr:VOC family protein [SAR202 cluster bacterium]MDP6300082.1 VOC family protein [SAR202 cluster bacterium]MDP7103511.1 VOC family protein [SAR202 cluster bacterium]MDP7225723.1 VOC family protein [SAR202 cluster bacterium]MDP7412290.1 VOC family protein [SAR202 cluster bacterium]|tara:strand:+ start:4138 stop:4575 length:438 start_codon:yes stop_codon:yes gene_type:complete
MITGMNHTGFVVGDIDRSVDFYTNTVGLKLIVRRERDGGPISELLAYENTHIKAAILSIDGEDGHVLELIEYVNPSSASRPTTERAVLGASHIAFNVTDIEGTFDRLIAAGAIKLARPVEMGPDRVACYLQDPDGNWVELIEITE